MTVLYLSIGAALFFWVAIGSPTTVTRTLTLRGVRYVVTLGAVRPMARRWPHVVRAGRVAALITYGACVVRIR